MIEAMADIYHKPDVVNRAFVPGWTEIRVGQ